MGVIWTPGKRETQPDSATRVLTELPLARGLRVIKNLRSSEKLVTVGDPTSVVRKDGRGFYYSSGAYHTVESPVSFAGEVTVVISVVVRSWPASGVFFGRYAGAISNWERMPFSIQKSGSADQFTFGRSGESGSRSWYGIPGSLSVDTPYVVGWSSAATSVANRSTSSEKIWINGVKQTVKLDYAEGSGAFADYLSAIRIGAAEDNAPANSELYFAAVWDRALTDAELAAVTTNPWQLFEPDNDPAFYSLGGGAALIDVPAGAVTITGYAPTVTAGGTASTSVPAGAVTLTAYAPTVTAGGTASTSVPLGTVTLTGYAPTVTVGGAASIDVPLGTVALTGYAPTVTTGGQAQIDVPLGTVTLTGYVPTVTTTEHVYIAVPTAAMTLAAYAPTVTTSGTPDTWTPVSASTGTWTPQ